MKNGTNLSNKRTPELRAKNDVPGMTWDQSIHQQYVRCAGGEGVWPACNCVGLVMDTRGRAGVAISKILAINRKEQKVSSQDGRRHEKVGAAVQTIVIDR